MRHGKVQLQPPLEHAGDKRKFHPPMKQFQHTRFTKKRKSASETLAPTPPPQSKSSTNYCNFSPWSPETHRNFNKNHRSRKPNIEDRREWVCSPGDHSIYRDKVVLVSYNLLGVENALKHPDLYHNVPPQFLEWDHRKELLCKEIAEYQAGILCLQEVDRFSDLDNCLQKDGFKSVHQARTGDACDGCAMFWKNEIFSLLHQDNIVYQQFDLRDNVAQLCVFEMNQHQSSSSIEDTERGVPSRRLVVGNIHVLFNPSRGDIKLGQIRLFVQKAYELSQEWGNIPVVLAGDFNSMPQSAIYQFLTSSELNIELHDRRQMSEQISMLKFSEYQARNNCRRRVWNSVSRPLKYKWSRNEIMLATGDREVKHLKHSLELRSAYPEVGRSFRTRDTSGEPYATSYHSSFLGTCDYIWHTPELVPVRVLDTLPLYILRKTGGLPSENWGSDHLALVCELAFVDDDDKSCCTTEASSSSRCQKNS